MHTNSRTERRNSKSNAECYLRVHTKTGTCVMWLSCAFKGTVSCSVRACVCVLRLFGCDDPCHVHSPLSKKKIVSVSVPPASSRRPSWPCNDDISSWDVSKVTSLRVRHLPNPCAAQPSALPRPRFAAPCRTPIPILTAWLRGIVYGCARHLVLWCRSMTHTHLDAPAVHLLLRERIQSVAQ